MIIESRRDFLKSILLSASTFELVPSGLLKITNTTADTGVFHELSVINHSWVKHYKVPPSFYLERLSSNLWEEPLQLKKLIKDEFRTKRTIEINGLILSQTEAAILAFCADQLRLS